MTKDAGKKLYKASMLTVAAAVALLALYFFYVLIAPPRISGFRDIDYVLGAPLPDVILGVSAKSVKGEDLTAAIRADDSHVLWEEAGSYPLFYSVQDKQNKQAQVSVTVHISDRYPVIEVASDAVHIIGSANISLLDFVTAYDYTGRDITQKVTSAPQQLDGGLPGIYDVKYTVFDNDGNSASIETAIKVMHPWPIVTLSHNKIEVFLGDSESAEAIYTNASAIDQLGIDITCDITINDKELDIYKTGLYTVMYSVKGIGNSVRAVSASVEVILKQPDTNSPTLQTEGDLLYFIPAQDIFQIPPRETLMSGVIAEDNLDGDIIDRVAVDCSEVNFGLPGNYTLKYTVMDNDGNQASILRQIKVVDNIAPVFYNFTTEIFIDLYSGPIDYIGDIYAYDNVDGNCNIAFEHNIDYENAGEYYIQYTAMDLSGNTSTIRVAVIIA